MVQKGRITISIEIAEPIPMKRELKQLQGSVDDGTLGIDCRAYPDEKGIETSRPSGRLILAARLQSLSR